MAELALPLHLYKTTFSQKEKSSPTVNRELQQKEGIGDSGVVYNIYNIYANWLTKPKDASLCRQRILLLKHEQAGQLYETRNVKTDFHLRLQTIGEADDATCNVYFWNALP